MKKQKKTISIPFSIPMNIELDEIVFEFEDATLCYDNSTGLFDGRLPTSLRITGVKVRRRSRPKKVRR